MEDPVAVLALDRPIAARHNRGTLECRAVGKKAAVEQLAPDTLPEGMQNIEALVGEDNDVLRLTLTKDVAHSRRLRALQVRARHEPPSPEEQGRTAAHRTVPLDLLAHPTRPPSSRRRRTTPRRAREHSQGR
jgi:hypothetical protein